MDEPIYERYGALSAPDDDTRRALTALLEASFPAHERRSPAGQALLFAQPDYRVLALRAGGRLGGFLCWWALPGFRFIEHFAVAPELRNKGQGGAMLEFFLRESPEPCVLEAEPPETGLARRRLDFYGRHGFVPCPFGYRQLPMRPGDGETPLVLLSTRPLADRTSFEAVCAALRSRVYACGTNLR